jgi:hypothetical protein
MTISIGQVGVTSGFNTIGVTTGAVTTSASGSGFVIAAVYTSTISDTLTDSVVDSFGNAYTALTRLSFISGGALYIADRWLIAPGASGYVGGGASHTATVTITTSSAESVFLALIEMPGAATSNAAFYGAAASHNYPFSSSPPYASTSLAVAPPAAGAVLLSCLACQAPSAGTGTESTGFTVELTNIQNPGGGSTGGSIGLKAVTASATYTPNWSWSTTTGVVEAFSTIDSFFGGSSQTAPIVSSLSSMNLGPG